jgi:hypothetical protein
MMTCFRWFDIMILVGVQEDPGNFQPQNAFNGPYFSASIDLQKATGILATARSMPSCLRGPLGS